MKEIENKLVHLDEEKQKQDGVLKELKLQLDKLSKNNTTVPSVNHRVQMKQIDTSQVELIGGCEDYSDPVNKI